jgi:hypothetical protein
MKNIDAEACLLRESKRGKLPYRGDGWIEIWGVGKSKKSVL